MEQFSSKATNNNLAPWIDSLDLNNLICPDCKSLLSPQKGSLFCKHCSVEFQIKNHIPILLPQKSLDNKYGMDYIEHYVKDAEHFDYFQERQAKVTEHDERRLREYIISLTPRNSKNILDLGSGGAWVANSFHQKDITSFDISYINLDKALNQENRKNHFAVVGDALNPPFANNSFDCIIASEIIEHIVSPSDFINAIIPLLKSGGTLIISTPYKEKLHYSQCIHCNKPTPKNAHLHSFDENILISLFDKKLQSKLKYYIFGNKALIILRTYIILKYIPFFIWKIIDKIANFIIKKNAHIIIVYKKGNNE